MSTEHDLFISYRRSDAGGHAGRLYDRLRHWFDDGVIFYDLDAIDMGDVFPARIENALNSARVVLVVIGPDWVKELNRRSKGTAIDFVRREVELALGRHQNGNLPLLLPVLVGGEAMPDPVRLLPDLAGLAPFCSLNTHTFQGTQADWDRQFVRLRERLAQVPGMPEPRFRAPMGIEQPFRITGDSLSPYFQDPHDLVSQLRSQLTASHDPARGTRTALYGMGGVGKTQLALKFSLDYRDAYAGVWWFASENETTLQLDAQAACQKVSAPAQPGDTPTMTFNRWLDRQQQPWLLVYDNAEDPAGLRPNLPRRIHHQLITSRNPAWSGLASPLELDIWTPEQGADFLADRLQSPPRDLCLELAHDLGGLPLALEQAASYIEQTGSSMAEYRQLLASVETEGLILDEGRAATGYERTVAATLTLAMDRLSEPAQYLLNLCAFAAPEPLPERFIREAGEQLPEGLVKAAETTLSWNGLSGELRCFGLIKRIVLPPFDGVDEEQAISLHRLTQQAIRSRCSNPTEICHALLSVLTCSCPPDSSLPQSWPRYALLSPHIIHLDRFIPTGWLDSRLLSRLLNQLGNYLREGPALYGESVQWLKRAVDIDRHDLGEEHPDTLDSMNDLALTLWNQGNFQDARVLQEKILESRARVLGEDHPDTLISMNNLALTLQDQGDLQNSQALHEKVLEVSIRILGEDHPDTLSSMNNLADTLWNQGDLKAAQTLEEKALEVRTRVLGKEHPDTLTSMNSLAGTLHSQGDLQGARVLYEKVLEVRTRVLGEEHPDTLTAMNNLAGTLHSQGDLQGARALHEKALEVRTRVLGEEHPDTLTAMGHLAVVLCNQDDFQGARALQEKVLEISARALGEEHPSTSVNAWNLFCTLDQLEEDEAAQALLNTHLLWLLERDPATLGATQQNIREDLLQIV